MRLLPSAVLACLLIAWVAGTAGAAPRLPLGTEGRWIVDADGRAVILHGHNRIAKQAPYAPDADGFSDEDGAFLAAEGYNSIRLGVIWTAVEPAPGVYDDAYLDRIERTVRMLARHGVLSTLDFHQDQINERFQGQGFPDWALFPTRLPNPTFGFPLNYAFNPALMYQFDRLYANASGPGGVGIQDRYADAWRHVAARFRDVPGIAGYDLINEPFYGSKWPTCLTRGGCPRVEAKALAFQERVARRIRTIDPNTPVWFAPIPSLTGGPIRMPPLPKGDSVLSFHIYCSFATLLPGRSGPLCDPFNATLFRDASAFAERSGASLVLSEFGSTDDLPELERVVREADRRMIGWQHWAYTFGNDATSTGDGTQGIVFDDRLPPTGANIKPRKLEVLSRPYPQVVAGTPMGWSFDRRRGVFSTVWRTTSPAGQRFPSGSQTELAMPARQFPHGYEVVVSGGTVRSVAGAGVLVVAAAAGADEVRVSVTRRAAPR